MKITIVGAGYVGLSLATLLSLNYEVVILDIDNQKVEKINSRISPIEDKTIKEYFNNSKLNLYATLNNFEAYENSDFVIICVPTNFDENTNNFDVSIINEILADLKKSNYLGTIVIKSTIPIGYTNIAIEKYNLDNVLFSPEFLRESSSIVDNLYPSRIIVGANENKIHLASGFIDLLLSISLNKNVETFIMKLEEAEAVKLFSNAYLAMRVAFFNELDIYAEINKLNSLNIIKGVCADKRIGNYYNNPSFGYGGYCLPKDTKQLVNEYNDIPQSMFTAICESNTVRKNFIANSIITKISNNKNSDNIVGIYRLIMKSNSDNFRNSAIFDIIEILKEHNIKIVIYEPHLKGKSFYNELEVINNFEEFKAISTLIIANRIDNKLVDVKEKVYSRDIFGIN